MRKTILVFMAFILFCLVGCSNTPDYRKVEYLNLVEPKTQSVLFTYTEYEDIYEHYDYSYYYNENEKLLKEKIIKNDNEKNVTYKYIDLSGLGYIIEFNYEEEN